MPTTIDGSGNVNSVQIALANQGQAEEGINNATLMTPLRVEQHMLANDLGRGQSWSSPTRVADTDYTNSTGRPIFVTVTIRGSTASSSTSMIINGVTVASTNLNDSFRSTMSAVVPDGATYKVAFNSGSNTIMQWAELR